MAKFGEKLFGTFKFGEAYPLAYLIRSPKVTPIRRLYMKRRDLDGTFESSWVRIDKFNAINRVAHWGNFSHEIDEENGRIGGFNISPLNLKMFNDDGLFNVETDSRSYWGGGSYLNRRLTKIKVDAAYLAPNGDEMGEVTIFEGVIENVTISDDQFARIKVLPYTSILKKYDISDLSLTGDVTVSAIVTSITNQSKITDFITVATNSPDQNVTIDDSQNLTGNYWEVMKKLALVSNSVPLIITDQFYFKARNVGATSVYDFLGRRAADQPDIYKVLSFDDEGADRVRLHWREDVADLESISTNVLLLNKYLGEPESIDLSDVKTTADKQLVLDALVTQWENPKPLVEFSARFLLNNVNPLDKITIDHKADTINDDDKFIWGSSHYDDGKEWAEEKGAVIIDSVNNWKVLKVKQNIHTWETTIKAEMIDGF